MTRSRPLRYAWREIDERAGASDLPLLSVSKEHGVVPRHDLSDDSGRADSFEQYKVCRTADLLINRMSAYQGALGVARQGGLVSPDYAVLRAARGVSVDYLSYFLRSAWGRGEIVRRLRGIGGVGSAGNVRTPRVSVADLGTIAITMTDHDQQRSIADFLDRECARIEALRQQLTLFHAAEQAGLSESREALLATLGSPVRLKYGLKEIVDTAHATCPQVDGGGHWVIRTAGVRDGRLVEAGCYETDAANFEQWTRRRVPRPGDVVFTREAPAGEAAVITPERSWCLGQRSVLLVLREAALDPQYVVMALYGRAVRDEIRLRSRSTTAAHLNVGEIGELAIPQPDLSEQRDTLGKHEKQRVRFSRLGQEVTALRSSLTEYRDALITEAVTGQLDVSQTSDASMNESLHAVREDLSPEVLAR